MRHIVFGFVCIFLAVVPGMLLAQEDIPPPTPTGEPTSTQISPTESTVTATASEPEGLQTTLEPTSAPSESALPTIPPEIANNDSDWPLANRDYRNTRAVFNSRINSATVNNLEVAWAFPIPGRSNFGAAASAPVIAAGVVYFQDLESNVFALDLLTGAVIWEQRYNNGVIGPNGPGIGYGKVFVTSGVESFAALDMRTGTEVWSVSTNERPTGAIQPYVYGGLVYFTTQAGVAGEGEERSYRGYAGGTSGHILALNPETGETVWDFQTIEEGFWGNPEVNSGAGVWYPPAIDTSTGLTFWGTGNPAPFPGTFQFPNASSIEEPALYANTMLALQHDTGELVWYNYVNPNDLFDLDFQISPVLASVQFGGQQREIVIGTGKLGRVIAFDRETGEIIWETLVGIHQNDDLSEIPPGESVIVYPGILGGVETPIAYADNTVYVPVMNLPTEHAADGWGAADGVEALAAANARTAAGQGTSEVVALNATNGQILWSHEFGSDMYGGVTIVNDLLFVATYDGMIYALNRATGETVWSYQAPGGINAWPAVANDTIVWPVGAGGQPSLVALRLPLDLAEETAEATPEAEATEAPETDAAEETPAPGEEAEATEAPEADVAEETPAPGEEADAEVTETPAAETEETTPEAGAGDTAGAAVAEQAQGEQVGEFMTVDAENQTVTLSVIAAYDSSNGGLNFNGYANGEATFVVPEGWTVEIQYDNESAMPHSAGVVPTDVVDRQRIPTQPVFEGAITDSFLGGTTQPESFSFTADQQGTFAIVCGVPGHGASGQWIALEVGASDVEPAFQTGNDS